MATDLMQRHGRKVLAHQQKLAQGQDAEPEAGVNSLGDAEPDPSFVALAGGLSGLKVRKRVTTPAILFPDGSAIVCQVLEPIHESEVEDKRFGGAKAQVCKIQAMNGDVRVLIAGKVLQVAFEREYPAQSYVGCWFHIAKLARPEKNYSDYAITEIEPPASDAA